MIWSSGIHPFGSPLPFTQRVKTNLKPLLNSKEEEG